MKKLIVFSIVAVLLVFGLSYTPFKSEKQTGPQIITPEDLPSLTVSADNLPEREKEVANKDADDERKVKTMAAAEEKSARDDVTLVAPEEELKLAEENARVTGDDAAALDKEPDGVENVISFALAGDTWDGNTDSDDWKDQTDFVETADEPISAVTWHEPFDLASLSESGLEEEVHKDLQDADPADIQTQNVPSNQYEKQNELNETDGQDRSVPSLHVHSFSLTSFREPGCAEDGIKVYTCECGDSYEDIIPALDHQWEVLSTYEAIDAESYCKFKRAVITCTSPFCFEGDTPITVFDAKDYEYSYEKLDAAYEDHETQHLLNGQQASYTPMTIWSIAPASMYEQLFAEQNKSPRAVVSLELIPAMTHMEQTYRCSRCGAEQ